MSSYREITDQYSQYNTEDQMHSYTNPHASESYCEEVAYPFAECVSAFLKGQYLLDLASGDGVIVKQMTQKFPLKPLCLDVSAAGLDLAKQDRVRALTAPLPFKSKSIAGVHFKDAMVHTPDQALLVSEICRVLVAGGFGIIVSQFERESRFYAEVISEAGCIPLNVTFTDEADCLKVYHQTLQQYPDNQLKMGPPYFATHPDKTIDLLEKNRCKIIFDAIWKPRQQEWHNLNTNRYVLMFQTTQS